MKTARFAACLPLLFAPCATAAEIVPVTVGERIDLVAGQTADGCIWTAPAATPGEPGPFTAFVFLGTECPMAQSYGVVLSGLADEFADRGVHMVGVMSNAQDDAGEIIRFAQQQGVAFPLLHDPDAALADRFGATRTPEVFVLGPDRRVRYHGRIDDRLDRGANRGAALNTDLKNALTELSAGREVSQPETPFTGCRIGRRPKPQQTVVDAPTFKEHVAPLLHAKCAECHRPGQVAPFSMDKPEEVQLWAPTIAEAVAERRMPPWSADPRYGEWKHDLNLSSDEIAMLQRWSDAGAPLGDGEPPAFPSFPDGWLLGEPDLIVELPAYDVQPGEEDWWPKLSATVPLDGERWIQAIEVAPGNPKVVHHLGLSFGGMSTMGQAADDEGGSPRGGAGGRFGRGDAGGGNVDRRERFRQMLQQRRGGGGGRGGFGGRFGGGEPGGRGFNGGQGGGDMRDRLRDGMVEKMRQRMSGGGGGRAGFLGAWAAGSPPKVFPDGVGIPISPGPDGTVTFRAAMHYHPTTNQVETDRTRIGIHFGEGELKKEVGMGAATYLPIVLKPGEDNFETRVEYTFDDDAQIISFGPHMHFRGKDMTYIARYPNGEREILLSIPRYNFNYQWFYSPKEPVKIPAGTTIEAVAHFDNSAANPHNPDPSATVRFGPESEDEMSVGIFQFVAEDGLRPPKPDMRKRLNEWLAEQPADAPAYAGSLRLGGIIPGPGGLLLNENAPSTLIMPARGSVMEIDLGRLTWSGDRFRGELDNGYGLTTVTGERSRDGRTVSARIVIRNEAKNPFLRLWNRGIDFEGRLR